MSTEMKESLPVVHFDATFAAGLVLRDVTSIDTTSESVFHGCCRIVLDGMRHQRTHTLIYKDGRGGFPDFDDMVEGWKTDGFATIDEPGRIMLTMSKERAEEIVGQNPQREHWLSIIDEFIAHMKFYGKPVHFAS